MRFRLLAAVWLGLAAMACAQLISPVTVTSGSGASPTTQIDLTPGTTSFPCLSLAASPSTLGPSAWRLCGKDGSVQVDLGSGYKSLQGAQGPQGPIGPAGPTGATGATGAAGAMGPQGLPGPPGPQGLTGVTGLTGPAGPAGAAGPIGATGPAGPPGVAGPAGPAGPAGASGAPGPAGPPGPAGTIASPFSCDYSVKLISPGHLRIFFTNCTSP